MGGFSFHFPLGLFLVSFLPFVAFRCIHIAALCSSPYCSNLCIGRLLCTGLSCELSLGAAMQLLAWRCPSSNQTRLCLPVDILDIFGTVCTMAAACGSYT